MEEVGKMIRLRRKQLGLTQTQLAAKAEVSQQTVAALENGYVRKTTCLPALFHVLGLDINVVMKKGGAPVVEAYSLVTPKDIDVISQTIRDMLYRTYSLNTYDSDQLVISLGNIDTFTQLLTEEIVKNLAIEKQN